MCTYVCRYIWTHTHVSDFWWNALSECSGSGVHQRKKQEKKRTNTVTEKGITGRARNSNDYITGRGQMVERRLALTLTAGVLWPHVAK